jgi:3-isopropylmalate dehydratase small subunit
MFNREKAIETLVDNDFDTVMNSDYGVEYLRNILQIGLKGYANCTDEELMQELQDRDISYLFGETED